jgi:hypothetical protein
VRLLTGAGTYGTTRRRGANAFGTWSACPWVETTAEVASGDILAAAVVLGRPDEPAAQVRIAVRRGGSGEPDGHGDHGGSSGAVCPDDPGGAGDVVTVIWPDGECDLVPLDPVPDARTTPPDPRA